MDRPPAPSQRRLRGRSIVGNPEVLAVILGVMRTGAGKIEAARQAGVTNEGLHSWLRQGRDALRRRDLGEEWTTERDRMLGPFAEEFNRAEGSLKVYLLDVLRRATEPWTETHVETKGMGERRLITTRTVTRPGDPRAAEWLLERLWPYEFGSKSRIDVHADVETRPDLSRLTTDELMQLRAIGAKLAPSQVIDVPALTDGDDGDPQTDPPFPPRDDAD